MKYIIILISLSLSIGCSGKNLNNPGYVYHLYGEIVYALTPAMLYLARKSNNPTAETLILVKNEFIGLNDVEMNDIAINAMKLTSNMNIDDFNRILQIDKFKNKISIDGNGDDLGKYKYTYCFRKDAALVFYINEFSKQIHGDVSFLGTAWPNLSNQSLKGSGQ
jgi:hypothetical protein